MGIVWVYCVDNILMVNANGCWGFKMVCLCCNHHWWLIQNFYRVRLSLPDLMYMSLSDDELHQGIYSFL